MTKFQMYPKKRVIETTSKTIQDLYENEEGFEAFDDIKLPNNF